MKNINFTLIGAVTLGVTLTACGGSESNYLDNFKIDGHAYVVLDTVGNAHYIDGDGNQLFEKTFSRNAGYYFDGIARVWDADSSAYYFINKSGEKAFEGYYPSATTFVDGVAFVAKANQGLQAIDTKGNTLFSLPDAMVANTFDNGMARVTYADGRIGFVDKTGKAVIAANYKNAGMFINGLSCVVDTLGGVGLIDSKGKYVIDPGKYSSLSGAFYSDAITFVDKNAGLLNRKGEVVLDPVYTSIEGTTDGYFIVRNQEGLYGLVKGNGEVVITPTYYDMRNQMGQMIYAPGSRLFVAGVNAGYGVIDAANKVIVPLQYEDVYISNDEIFVKSNGRWGMVDVNNNVLIEPKFDRICPFYNGTTALATLDGKVVVIDIKGNVLKTTDYVTICEINPEIEAQSLVFDYAPYIKVMRVKLAQMIADMVTLPNAGTLMQKYSVDEKHASDYAMYGSADVVTSGNIYHYIDYKMFVVYPCTDAPEKALAKDENIKQASVIFTVKGCKNANVRAAELAVELAKFYDLAPMAPGKWGAVRTIKDGDREITYKLILQLAGTIIGVGYEYVD